MSDQQNALWGDGPALPKLPIPKSRLELKLEARDTPAGRAYELRLFHAELAVLFMGLLAIVLGAAWPLAIVAVALFVIGAMTAVDKFSWLQTEVIASSITAGLLVASAYGIRELGVASGRISALLSFTPVALIATAATGVITWHAFTAFNAAAGIATQLVEKQDRPHTNRSLRPADDHGAAPVRDAGRHARDRREGPGG
ncbi:hypothetical protein ARD30_07710 [Bosea thiooxidans]|uniref:Uncharacterized protein n=1 Tax=Bosea thiooxidans TaxID=53254 RepID=A0A0Q3T3A5_9HYPH|nr:hypothetical protein [Bosea thiooxidans]KQK32138.1 hypothetical protein ARD30_07710 [Bosea thiooxidans]